MVGQHRATKSWFIRKLWQLLKGFGALLALIIVLAAAENNWFGYAWRSTQLFVQGASAGQPLAVSPQSIMANTPSNSDGSKTILAVGDIVDCPEPDNFTKDLTTLTSWVGLDAPLDHSKVPAVATVGLAAQWPETPILALGDTVYRRGTPHEFADCFDPIWGSLGHRTLPTPGNHEYLTPSAYAYYDYWGLQAGPDRRGYYSVQSDGWLILSLNSEIDAVSNSAQGKWLDETLAAATEQCILAFYHRPAFSLRTRDSIGSEHQLFQKLNEAGASVVLNGHNHLYERSHPIDGNGAIDEEAGTVSFVVGTGGKSPLRERDLAAFTAYAVFGKQGVLSLTLEDGGFSWAFHDAETRAAYDEGRRDCNQHRVLDKI